MIPSKCLLAVYTYSRYFWGSGVGMVLGKLPVPGRPTNLDDSIALAVGASEGCSDIFSLVYHFSTLSPSLWETFQYRLKYCFKGPLSPEKPINQPIMILLSIPSRKVLPFTSVTFSNMFY